MPQSNISYISEKSRQESYKLWPFKDSESCNIQKMAEAGFFWCGTEKDQDSAQCFLCGKVLDGWEPSDDPWLEHVKHAPQCQFAKLGRAEVDLTVKEVYLVFETVMRNTLIQKHENEVNKLNATAEKFRTQIINSKQND